jgi:hypothetical protein
MDLWAEITPDLKEVLFLPGCTRQIARNASNDVGVRFRFLPFLETVAELPGLSSTCTME